MAAQDPWDTTTGLLDDFDFEVETAWFGFDDNYRDGEALLFKMRGVATIDGEVEDEEYTLQYSCGNGWVDAKGGEEAKNKGGAVQFNNSTGMGRLIDRFKELGAVDILRERGLPTQAETFVGLTLHIKREEVNRFTPKGETEEVVVVVPLPTEVSDGEVEEAPKKATRTRKPAAKTPAKTTKAPAKRASRAKKPSLRDEVIAFAADFEDHADFVSAVFDPDEFDRAEEAEADEELAEEILDAESELWEAAQE